MNVWVDSAVLDARSSGNASDAADVAAWVLYTLSGRRYGNPRTVTERYECSCGGCHRGPASRSGTWPPPVGTIAAIELVAVAPGACGCWRPQVSLRGRPVTAITEVKRADGTIVPASEYELADARLLRGVLTGAAWSACPWVTVTYAYQRVPPTAGRRAARAFAQELVNAWEGGDCQLPDRVTSVTRQGVSYTILDPQEFLKDGRVGIYEVDLFLQTVNPAKARLRPRVINPDLPRSYRVS